MKKYIILIILIVLNALKIYSYEEKGDSIIVQTLNFEDITKRSDSYLFPPLGSYEKIIMEYTLKCDPRTTRDRFDCGEWDYLTYTVVTDSSGREKINRKSNRKYEINGASPEEFQIFNDAPNREVLRILKSYTEFIPKADGEEYYGEIPKSDGAIKLEKGLYQFVYEKSDLPEKVNTVKLFSDGSEGILRVARVNIYTVPKADFYDHKSDKSSISYLGEIKFDENDESQFRIGELIKADIAEDDLVIMEVFVPDYKNDEEGVNLLSESSATYEQLHLEDHKVGYFAGNAYLEVPKDALKDVDSEITISFWVRGDANHLPRNTSILEAVNDENQRILNLHFPWNNSQVYWDAGNSGTGYDRVNKTMEPEDYLEGWNHWAFTKNTNTGDLKAYLNGEEFMSAVDKSFSMSGIERFVLGANSTGRNNWYGWIRDFAIWDKELSSEEISENLENQNTLYDPILRYKMTNDEFGIDVSGNNFDAESFGKLESHPFENFDYISENESSRKNYNIGERPIVQFIYEEPSDQTINNFENEYLPIEMHESNVIVYDHNSIDEIIPIEEWEDRERELNTPTDTVQFHIASEYSYKYSYSANGLVKTQDSTMNEDIETISNNEYYWYSPIVNYEIDRFITPYGIGLDLGEDGFTWKIDVTDYAPILHDWVRFSAGNQQELIDVKFIFIKGTPARDIVDLKTVYRRATYKYPQIVDETHLAPVSLDLNPEASNWRVKTRSSGHRFGVDGTDNCAEFCNRLHSLWIDGEKEYEWEGWLECGDNPVYPQGGNWVSDRTDWCPGAPVTVYNHEITDAAAGKASIEIDYDIEEKPEFTTYGDWVMNGMLVEYGEPNFTYNASIERIIAPSSDDEFIRFNPICDDARIIVSNQGSEEINSIEFKYSIDNYEDTYLWEGSIEFTKSQEIIIPLFFDPLKDFINDPEKIFEIEIVKVNGEEDEYARNNKAQSRLTETDNYFSDFVMSLRTNDYSHFNINYVPMIYRLRNLNTNSVIFEGENPERMSLVTEEADLEKGCYEIWLENTVGWGLEYSILEQQGIFLQRGNFKLENNDFVYRNFPPDFGNYIRHHFRVSDQIKANYSTEVLDFGKIEIGETKSLTLNISPDNYLPLTIEKADLGISSIRGFAIISSNPSLEDGPVTLKEGEEFEIEIELKAKTDEIITGDLTLITNDARHNNKEIQLIANGQTSVALEKNELNIGVSPNPVKEQLNVEISIESGLILNSNLSLYSSLGNKVADLYNGELSIKRKSISYSVEHLSSGTYYLVLQSGKVSKAIPLIITK